MRRPVKTDVSVCSKYCIYLAVLILPFQIYMLSNNLTLMHPLPSRIQAFELTADDKPDVPSPL